MTKYTRTSIPAFGGYYAELATWLDEIDLTDFLDWLDFLRIDNNSGSYVGRRGYDHEPLLRAYLLSYRLESIGSTNDLIRRLRNDGQLRLVCGFGDNLPHRSTFNRFYAKVAYRCQADASDLMVQIGGKLAKLLPGFGKAIAIDGSNVYTHARQPKAGKPPSTTADPEAHWSIKTSKGKRVKPGDIHFGYKYHLMADAKYGLPIIGLTTPGNGAEQPEFRRLLKRARNAYGKGFSPDYVTADKGYDSSTLYTLVEDFGAVPIIARRDTDSKKGRERAADGSPTCIGGKPMAYVKTEQANEGPVHVFRCPDNGCHLKERTGVLYCKDTLKEQVGGEGPRCLGSPSSRDVSLIPRQAPLWKKLYDTRQSVERVFKGMKQSRRLNGHCFRGLARVALHDTLSALAFQVTALRRLRTRDAPSIRWMVKHVA